MAQSCLNGDANCLSDWNFEYLYIRRVKPQKEGGIQGQVSLLEASLRASGGYSVVYDSDVAVIFLQNIPSP